MFAEQARRALDPRLVSPRAVSGLGLASVGLPDRAFDGMAGVEVRLADGDDSCDLSVCALRPTGSGWLGEWARDLSGPCGEFARAWSAGRSAGRSALEDIGRVWLEFDCDTASSVPGVTLGGTFFSCRIEPPHGGPGVEERRSRSALSLLVGTSAADDHWRAIRDLQDRLGVAAGTVFQLGAMVGRTGSPVRVCVLPRHLDQADALLDAIPDRDVRATARTLLARYRPVCRLVCVDLDLDADGWLPSVGLELYVELPGEVATAARWRDLLAGLRAGKLISAGKAAALATYPQCSPVERTVDAGPAAALLSDHRRRRLVANAHHIKLTVRAGAAPSAKAYLALWREWSSARTR